MTLRTPGRLSIHYLGKNSKTISRSELSVTDNIVSDSKAMAEAFNDYFVANNTAVSQTDTHKCLEVQIDEKLTWDSHIEIICKKASVGIGAMRRIRAFDRSNSIEKVYDSLVQPYFDYCSPLRDNCGKLLKDKLQRFQSRAARVITSASYDARSASLIEALSWVYPG